VQLIILAQLAEVIAYNWSTQRLSLSPIGLSLNYGGITTEAEMCTNCCRSPFRVVKHKMFTCATLKCQNVMSKCQNVNMSVKLNQLTVISLRQDGHIFGSKCANICQKAND